MNNLIKINSVEHLTAMVKAIVPRSFEKTFGGLSTDEVVAGFMFCVAGFSQTELNIGLQKIKDMGYCPDPAMFAKWCKGIDGFDNRDYIADSYIGKTGALASILAWRDDDTRQITVAEKLAYDDVYHVFEQADRLPSMMITAHVAFMDKYEMVVRELVANRQPCQVWQAPVAVEYKETTKNHEPRPDTFNLGASNWVRCFDGYSPSDSFVIVQKLRAKHESMKQAYQRIWTNGVANSLPAGVSVDGLIGRKPMKLIMPFGANKMDYLGAVA